jgi:hypothetical protein
VAAILKQIRIRISDLLDQHEESLDKCKGCPICTEIKVLRKQLERDPAEKFQHILSKGQDMKKSDIVFLLENEVQKKVIWKALGISQSEFWALMKNFGLQNRKSKGEEIMGKLTLELYQDYKAQGKSDTVIARELGIKQPTLSYHKKNWFGAESKPAKAEKKMIAPKDAPEEKTAEYEQTMKTLQYRMECFKKELSERNDYILELQTKVEELESVHAACEDVESEIVVLQEELEKERQANKSLPNVSQIVKENAVLKELLRLYL